MDGPAGSQKACLVLISGKLQACFFGAFFWTQFFSIFFDVGSILGGFGRPKRSPKSIFGRPFFDVFFECVLASILGGFLEAPNLENMHGA